MRAVRRPLPRGAAVRVWPLAWPLFVEMGLGIAVGIVCTALAARRGDAAAAAFALAQHVFGMLFIFFRVIGAGIAAVLAQRLGAGHCTAADAVARAALAAASWIGLGCALLACVGAEALLRAVNAPPALLPAAAALLRWLAPVMVLDAWNAAMAAVMRSHLRSREALAVVLVMHATLLALAPVLMPQLGLAGFALAALASRALGFALHARLWRVRLSLAARPADFWRLPRAEVAALLHIGVPGAAENIAYRLCYLASVAVVGTLGGSALATHAYVTQLNHAGLLFGVTVGLAMEILVAHLVGAGRLHAANGLLRRWLARSLVVSVLGTSLVAWCGPSLLRQFTPDAGIVALGAALLWWTVLLEPGRTFNLVVINALRAAGDARFPVMAGVLSMLVVLAGGSWLLGDALGLGLIGVWIAYAADEWLRGVVMWARWRSLAWVPRARAARRRAARQAPAPDRSRSS